MRRSTYCKLYAVLMCCLLELTQQTGGRANEVSKTATIGECAVSCAKDSSCKGILFGKLPTNEPDVNCRHDFQWNNDIAKVYNSFDNFVAFAKEDDTESVAGPGPDARCFTFIYVLNGQLRELVGSSDVRRGQQRPCKVLVVTDEDSKLMASVKFSCRNQCSCADLLAVRNVRKDEEHSEIVSACLIPTESQSKLNVSSATGNYVILEVHKAVTSHATFSLAVWSVGKSPMATSNTYFPEYRRSKLIKADNSNAHGLVCHRQEGYVSACPTGSFQTQKEDALSNEINMKEKGTTQKTIGKHDAGGLDINTEGREGKGSNKANAEKNVGSGETTQIVQQTIQTERKTTQTERKTTQAHPMKTQTQQPKTETEQRATEIGQQTTQPVQPTQTAQQRTMTEQQTTHFEQQTSHSEQQTTDSEQQTNYTLQLSDKTELRAIQAHQLATTATIEQQRTHDPDLAVAKNTTNRFHKPTRENTIGTTTLRARHSQQQTTQAEQQTAPVSTLTTTEPLSCDEDKNILKRPSKEKSKRNSRKDKSSATVNIPKMKRTQENKPACEDCRNIGSGIRPADTLSERIVNNSQTKLRPEADPEGPEMDPVCGTPNKEMSVCVGCVAGGISGGVLAGLLLILILFLVLWKHNKRTKVKPSYNELSEAVGSPPPYSTNYIMPQNDEETKARNDTEPIS